jgi:hypothetical protein
MHVLRVVRVLLPLLIVAALVGAGSSVLSARPDLQRAEHNVKASWTSVSGQLDNRYVLLAKVDDNLRAVPGPIHAIVTDLDGALSRWRAVHGHSGVATQVNAANDVEALARRLIATETISPRVKGNGSILTAVGNYLGVSSTTAATAFNARVVSYERERRGPVRAVVARLLGDGEIPVLDTTSPPVTATGASA